MSEEMVGKTIKELADEFGVTKQAIEYQIKKLPEEHYEKSDKGMIIVGKEGVETLKAFYVEGKKIPPKPAVKKQEKVTASEVKLGEQGGLKELSKAYEAHISTLLEENKMKNSQIETLQKLLDQQQQLTLQTNKYMDQLQMKVSEELPSPETTTASEGKIKDKTNNDFEALHEEFIAQMTELDQLKLRLQEKEDEAARLKEKQETAKEVVSELEEKQGFWAKVFKKKEKIEEVISEELDKEA